MKKKIFNLVLVSTVCASVLPLLSCTEEVELGSGDDQIFQQVPASFATLDFRNSVEGDPISDVEEDLKEQLKASSKTYIEWRNKNVTFFNPQGKEKIYDNTSESFVPASSNNFEPIKLYYKLTTKEQNAIRYIAKKVIEQTQSLSSDGEVSNILLIVQMIKFLRLQNELNISKQDADIIAEALSYKYANYKLNEKHQKMKDKLSQIKKSFSEKNIYLEYTLDKAKEAIQNKVPAPLTSDINKYEQQFMASKAGLIFTNIPEDKTAGAPADGAFVFFDKSKNTFVNDQTLSTGSTNTLNLYTDSNFDNNNLKNVSIYIANRIDEILSRDQNNIFYERNFSYNIFDFISVILNAIVWEDKAANISKITKTEANIIAEAFAESNSTSVSTFNEKQAVISKILRDIKIYKVTRSQDFIFRWQDAASAIIKKIMPKN